MPPNSQQPQNAIIGYSFHAPPPKTFYCLENLKMPPLKSRAIRHSLPNWRTVRKSVQKAVTDAIAANGIRATCLIPCDKNIFRPHDFPLYSEDRDAAPVNHRALVNTSDQPSFCSSNFSPFTSAEAVQSSDIKTCAKAEPKARSSWWNSK